MVTAVRVRILGGVGGGAVTGDLAEVLGPPWPEPAGEIGAGGQRRADVALVAVLVGNLFLPQSPALPGGDAGMVRPLVDEPGAAKRPVAASSV
jgi:hypothetical protein